MLKLFQINPHLNRDKVKLDFDTPDPSHYVKVWEGETDTTDFATALGRLMLSPPHATIGGVPGKGDVISLDDKAVMITEFGCHDIGFDDSSIKALYHDSGYDPNDIYRHGDSMLHSDFLNAGNALLTAEYLHDLYFIRRLDQEIAKLQNKLPDTADDIRRERALTNAMQLEQAKRPYIVSAVSHILSDDDATEAFVELMQSKGISADDIRSCLPTHEQSQMM